MKKRIDIVSESEFYELLTKPYNPANEYNDIYEKEHREVYHLVQDRLHQLVGGERRGCYFEHFTTQDDCWTVSRFTSACLSDDKFLEFNLVEEIVKIVDAFPYDYMFHICHEFDSCSDFELTFTKERILGFFADPDDINRITK